MRTAAIVRAAISVIVFGAIGAAPCVAQTRLTSLDELRRELAEGDVVTVIPVAGQAVKGRLVRLGPDELGIRPVKGPPDRRLRDVTIRFDAVQSLRRPRDSARDGAAIGAGVGAAFAGALMGLGALIGWAVDAAHSKRDIRFEAKPSARPGVSVRPVFSRGRGLGLAVS